MHDLDPGAVLLVLVVVGVLLIGMTVDDDE